MQDGYKGDLDGSSYQRKEDLKRVMPVMFYQKSKVVEVGIACGNHQNLSINRNKDVICQPPWTSLFLKSSATSWGEQHMST